MEFSMTIQQFLNTLANMGVRPAFESAQAYDEFWSELQDSAHESIVAADKARRESEAEAYNSWRT